MFNICIMNKKDVNIYFPGLENTCVDIWQQEVPSHNKDLPVLNEEIERIKDSLYPVDPVTGDRSNDVSKLLSSSVSPMEKERILAGMQKIPAARRHNLSDEDLIKMLPSRRNSTLVDVDEVRRVYEEEILPAFEAEQAAQVQQGSEQGSEQGVVE